MCFSNCVNEIFLCALLFVTNIDVEVAKLINELDLDISTIYIRLIYSLLLVLPNGTGSGPGPVNFYFPVPPGTGTDSARWHWLYNWPGQPPDEQSRRLIRHAEPSINTAHDTHYTNSVAVLNLSWQHSGKLLVFLPIFAFLNLNCPLRNARGKPVSRLPFWITARQIIICGWATLLDM